MSKPSIAELMAAVPISKTYASDILSGKQPPSRGLAIHIYRKTDWAAPVLDGLTDDEIDVLERVHPWPRQVAA